MYNMGSRSFIMTYIIIMSMSLLIQRTLFTYMNSAGDITHPKRATLKTCKSLFSAFKFANERYFCSFYLVLVIQEFIGNDWKRNLCKLPSLFLNVYSTGRFRDITGNDDLFL